MDTLIDDVFHDFAADPPDRGRDFPLNWVTITSFLMTLSPSPGAV